MNTLLLIDEINLACKNFIIESFIDFITICKQQRLDYLTEVPQFLKTIDSRLLSWKEKVFEDLDLPEIELYNESDIYWIEPALLTMKIRTGIKHSNVSTALIHHEFFKEQLTWRKFNLNVRLYKNKRKTYHDFFTPRVINEGSTFNLLANGVEDYHYHHFLTSAGPSLYQFVSAASSSIYKFLSSTIHDPRSHTFEEIKHEFEKIKVVTIHEIETRFLILNDITVKINDIKIVGEEIQHATTEPPVFKYHLNILLEHIDVVQDYEVDLQLKDLLKND